MTNTLTTHGKAVRVLDAAITRASGGPRRPEFGGASAALRSLRAGDSREAVAILRQTVDAYLADVQEQPDLSRDSIKSDAMRAVLRALELLETGTNKGPHRGAELLAELQLCVLRLCVFLPEAADSEGGQP